MIEEKDLSRMSDSELHDYLEYCKNKKIYHNTLQQVLKISINSLYGVIGNNYFNMYELASASGITSLGRMMIKSSAKIVSNFIADAVQNKENHDYLIGGDTDSIYVDFYSIIEKYGMNEKPLQEKVDFLDMQCKKVEKNALAPFFNRVFDELNCNENTMYMDREVIAVNDKPDAYCGFWVGKKHYVLEKNDDEGFRYEKPAMKIMGMSFIQTTIPEFVKKSLKECSRLLIEDGIGAVRKYAKKVKKEYYKLSETQIASPRSVSDIAKFTDFNTGLPHTGLWYDPELKKERNGGIPLHAAASINFNYLVKKMHLEKKYPLITDGAKIYYLYLKPNKYQFTAIAFVNSFPDEFKDFLQIDYDKMYEKQFEKPLIDILERCNLTLEEVRKLDEFF